MTDLRPSFEAFLGAFGLPAVVTVPEGTPVSTRAFWLPPETDQVPVGTELRRAETRRVLVLPRSEVPQVPRGTIVSVPEFEGEDAASWTVDEMDSVDFDHHAVVVLPA